MNVEHLYGAVRPRHRVWCSFEELDGSGGVYTLPDVPLGEGSEVLVVDRPGMLLIADASGQLYDWSGQD